MPRATPACSIHPDGADPAAAGDILARTGGDEFCILLPASTLREGAMIARRVLEVCREDAAGCVGADVPISLSIGVAQWTREIGRSRPDDGRRDHALYAAKNGGKNRYAVCDPAPRWRPASTASRCGILACASTA